MTDNKPNGFDGPVDAKYPTTHEFPVQVTCTKAPSLPVARVFVRGDLVQLQSGGPVLTVEGDKPDVRKMVYMADPAAAIPTGYISCVWFDYQGHVHREWFDPATLASAANGLLPPEPCA